MPVWRQKKVLRFSRARSVGKEVTTANIASGQDRVNASRRGKCTAEPEQKVTVVCLARRPSRLAASTETKENAAAGLLRACAHIVRQGSGEAPQDKNGPDEISGARRGRESGASKIAQCQGTTQTIVGCAQRRSKLERRQAQWAAAEVRTPFGPLAGQCTPRENGQERVTQPCRSPWAH